MATNYNEQLTQNNTKLDALKQTADGLPDYVEPKPEQTKDYTITANGDTPITPDPGKVITGGTIKVNVPSKTPVIKPITITANGTTTAPAGTDGYSPITVNVSGGGGGLEASVTIQEIEDMSENAFIFYVQPRNGKFYGPLTGQTTGSEIFLSSSISSDIVIFSDPFMGNDFNTIEIYSASDDFDIFGVGLTGEPEYLAPHRAWFINGRYTFEGLSVGSFLIRPRKLGTVISRIYVE